MRSRNRPTLIVAAIVILCLSAGSCLRRRLQEGELERNRAFAEIMKREDLRVLGDEGFFPAHLLGSPHPAVREWSAIGLGRIGSPHALPWLYEAFSSPYAAVRAAAAFAVGEIEDRETLKEEYRRVDARAAAELTALLDDSSLQVRQRAVEALGKIGQPSHAREVEARLENFKSSGSPEDRTYLGLAITALMRLNQRGSIPVLERLAARSDPEIQWRAVNALYRMRAAPQRSIVSGLLESPHSDLTAHAARWLGISTDPGAAGLLFHLLLPNRPASGDRIPLSVRVTAVQALGVLENREAISPIRAALESAPVSAENPDQVHFAGQAASALGQMGFREAESILVPLTRVDGPVAETAIIALGKLRRGTGVSFDGETMRRFTTESGIRALARALGELGGEPAIARLKAMLIRSADNHADSAHLLAIPAVLEALDKAGAPDLQSLLVPYLGSGDGVILRAAVNAYKPAPGTSAPWQPLLGSYRKIAADGDLEAKVALVNALEPWLPVDDVQTLLRTALLDRQRNVRIAASRLLRKSGATDVPAEPGASESATTEATYSVVASQRANRTFALLETGKGRIEIELYRQDAPLTVANFVRLARSGYYDNLTFMRVVPYFVIQGGDPRNDMEGGPGYTIRCEINMRPFERGSVGMALAGKDTGGSQFFITLSPQPHLDGGYTCFGRVISGMQVAERIVAGDRILKVAIKEDVTFLDSRRF